MSNLHAERSGGQTTEAKVTRTEGLCVLFGALRSGTTMLRLMIDSHPKLICPGETDFLTDYLVPTADGGWQYDLDGLSTNRIFQDSRARLPNTSEVGPAFQSMLADLRGDNPGVLTLVFHRGLGRLLDLAPDIPILHIIRDPRDVARSTIGMGWTGHVYYGAKVWLNTELEWERCAPRLAHGQSLELHYEPLVRDPETVLGDLCNFLGESYDPSMLNYSQSSTYSHPDPSLTQQWPKKQSPRELGLTEPLFGALLTQRGYMPSGHPPIHPSPAERLALWFTNTRAVWRHRIGRYGLRDPLLAVVAHKIGMPNLATSARKRMQDITRKHLK